MKFTTVTDPVWADAGHTAINCTVTFDDIGAVPFTASAADHYPHTMLIYSRALAGQYGPIAPFVASVPSPAEAAAEAKRAADALDVAYLKVDAKMAALSSKTPAQIRTYVNANVSSLADAKDMLATLASFVGVLARRL